jgi:hypothetical protein
MPMTFCNLFHLSGPSLKSTNYLDDSRVTDRLLNRLVTLRAVLSISLQWAVAIVRLRPAQLSTASLREVEHSL